MLAAEGAPLLVGDVNRRLRPTFVQGDRPPRVVWNDAEPLRVFGQVLSRRLLDAESGKPLPLGGTCLAPFEVVARLLSGGDLDLEQVAEWALAFSLIDWRAARPRVRRDSLPFAGELLLLGLFRPIFHENPHRLFEWLPKEPKPALARRHPELDPIRQSGGVDPGRPRLLPGCGPFRWK